MHRLLIALCLLNRPSPPPTSPGRGFVGPTARASARSAASPITWTDADYRWTVDLPGVGNSSPVVWGDKVFVTSADDTKLERFLLCYSTKDGKLLWSNGVPFPKEKKHKLNSYASNTPAVDAERVYAFWQSFEESQLLAYDHAGKLVWPFDAGPYKSRHGSGISPIVVDGTVALNLNHEGDSCLFGVDAATGKQKWRVPREVIRAGYSTPCIFTDASGRKSLIFTSWKHGFTAVDPQSGKIFWELPDVFGRQDEEDKRAIGSPFAAGGLVYGNCGFTGGKKYLAAVRPSTAAVDAPAEMAFRIDENVNHMPSGIVAGGLLFIWNDAGILVCIEADTGKEVWMKRIGGNFSSSPIAIDGKLYNTSDAGEVVVVAASEKFEELGRTLLAEGTSATPALDADTMYLRTYSKLYALPAKR